MTADPIMVDDAGVSIRVYVLPGASRTAVCGLYGDAVRIRLSVAAEKGAANKALETFLADRCGVRKRSVRIVRGTVSRRKTVRIEGTTEQNVRHSLGLNVGQDD
jgi:hypothetical protein